jgi:DNA polymerase-1
MHLVLIDGSGFVFRAFHALPPMTRPDGVPVNAVFGFTNMLARLLKDNTCSHLAVIFDAGRLTFRNRLYPLYKAQRPEPPEELRGQFPLVREATEAFGVPALELADWEADDLIAAYTRAAAENGGTVDIVSADKDLMQLIRPGVRLIDPIHQKPIGPAEVEARWGVGPERMADLLALMGDAADNVPGVPGIGPKTAAALLSEFGDLEALLAAAPTMKPSRRRDLLLQHAEAARLARRLVALRDDAPLPLPLALMQRREPDREALVRWLLRQGFRSTVQRLGLAEPAATATSGPASEPAAAYGTYATVTTEESLAAWVAEAIAAGVVAIDTETDGLDTHRAALVGFSLAVAPGRACYVPLRHEDAAGRRVEQLDPVRAMEIIAPLLADAGVLKVFFNAKFDLAVLERAGAPPAAPLDDAMLISYLEEAGRHGHGMDELALLHLDHRTIHYDAVTGSGRGRLPFAQVSLAAATAYAAEDADVTLRLWQKLRPGLRPAGVLALYEQVERRLIRVLMDMERLGVRVDAAELGRLSADFAQRMAAIERDIHALAGETFNVASPKQLGEILFDRMQLAGGRRMKTGAWGTDSSVLQGLAEQGHDLPARVLEWRQLQKLKSTYADALVEQINPATGRVHTRFAMAITSTGRLSSTDPNLQNIPIRTEEGGRIRRAFVAEPGWLLVSADYSQIELRLLAHVADVAALKASFAAGEDIHARTAAEVFGVPLAGMDPLVRRRAKAINFGIIYGISAFGLARQLGISPGEAAAYIDAYFARYPEIRTYMERTREQARRDGFVRSPFGRRCWIEGIADRNPARRGYAERQAINAPLQGGAADLIKRAMVRLPAALREAGLGARMLLQVHDEILLEAPAAEAAAAATVTARVMQGAAVLSVPLVVETGVGSNWATAH